MRKMPSQGSFQVMAWTSSAAFSQAYSENQDRKAEWKGWESVQFVPEEGHIQRCRQGGFACSMS